MLPIFRSIRALFRQTPWPKLQFPTSGFHIIGDEYLVEEEVLPHYNKSIYYPVNIGDVLASRYQVVGKLCFGVSSTVWLALCANAVQKANTCFVEDLHKGTKVGWRD